MDLFGLLPIFGGRYRGQGLDEASAPYLAALELRPILGGRLWLAELVAVREVVGGTTEEVVIFSPDDRGQVVASWSRSEHPSLRALPCRAVEMNPEGGMDFVFAAPNDPQTELRLGLIPGGRLHWGCRLARPEGPAWGRQLHLDREPLEGP